MNGVLQTAPFSKGVNFSAWFEANSAQSINFTKYDEQDFINVKSLGADVIRLPVKFHSMTSGAPNYTIDPLLFKFLDTAVDWAEKHELYIIIDNHSFDPVLHTPSDIDKILLPVWTQIARRYRNRSPYVIYEILNEPHGISDRRWGEVQGMAIYAIRGIDANRKIIVGGTDYNSIGKLSALPRYTDPHLIYTFHFYDPHIFTHQGAAWGEPSMAALAGVPFPYNSARMPEVPENLKGTWAQGALGNDYERASSSQTLYSTLDRVVAFSRERNVPVFCGEFGVYIPNANNEDRVRWYQFVVNALNNRNIAWTAWDYYGGFGIFKTERAGDFNSDLNVDVVRALGFTPPAQRVRRQEQLRTDITIYDDYPNRQLVTATFWGENDFSLYDTNTAEGEFAIRWGNAPQYNVFSFDFTNNADLSYLASRNFVLEFQARASRPANFDVRFLNPETASSTPWRMRYTINENILPADGRWHTIRIPLSEMREQGAWVSAAQQFISPQGRFSWQSVSTLQFVAEHSNMNGITVWFDNIRIAR